MRPLLIPTYLFQPERSGRLFAVWILCAKAKLMRAHLQCPVLLHTSQSTLPLRVFAIISGFMLKQTDWTGRDWSGLKLFEDTKQQMFQIQTLPYTTKEITQSGSFTRDERHVISWMGRPIPAVGAGSDLQLGTILSNGASSVIRMSTHLMIAFFWSDENFKKV